MIERSTVDRILDTARIEEVVSDFVSLKRRGANYIACCPFHHEKTPSFSVSPSKGIYKCFGCGKAGSVVSFVMEHEQMSYVEALKYLPVIKKDWNRLAKKWRPAPFPERSARLPQSIRALNNMSQINWA